MQPTALAEIVTRRGCLAHRGGVVSQRDCTATNMLELSWLALTVIIKGPTGEREVELPTVAEGGETISVVSRPRLKQFPLGATVIVDSKEFSQICWTLFLFAKGLAEALQTYGKAQGFKFVDKSDAA